MQNRKRKVALALSGGVDSAVAGMILKNKGYDLTALYLKLFTGDAGENQARVAAEFLKIPFYAIDAIADFKKKIIDYFLEEYKKGRTPNPCVKCNREIKFGILYDKVSEMGFDGMATGHYISKKQKSKKTKKQKIGRYSLYVAKDKEKDQSYFLYNLTQEILANVEFPLGNYTKKQVKAMAKKWNLPVSESESQDICFLGNTDHFERVGRGDFINLKKLNPPFRHNGGQVSPFAKGGNKKVDHNEFLKKYLKMRKGDILTLAGEKIGKHLGLPLYTTGQRRAVGIGGSGPYYVICKDIKKNILVVSEDRDDPKLYSNKLEAEEVNWISGKEPKFPIRVKVKIRYRQAAVDAEVSIKYQVLSIIKQVERYEKVENGTEIKKLRNSPCEIKQTISRGKEIIEKNYLVEFQNPQRAITSGQSVVFYKGLEMLGGGVIC